MIVFLVLVFLYYIVPAVIAYLGVRHQYKNEWKTIEPDLMDFILVLTPVLNFGMAIYAVMSYVFDAMIGSYDKVDKSNMNNGLKDKKAVSKFFRL